MSDKKHTLKVKIEAEPTDFVRDMRKTKEEGVASLNAVMSANKQTSISTREHAERVVDLEKLYRQSLTSSQKTALALAEVRKARVDDAAAAELQKKAIVGLEAKVADQLKRERANKGRSLSMLFDGLQNSLAGLPGPLGAVGSGIQQLSAKSDAAAGGVGSLVNSLVKGEEGTVKVEALMAATAMGIAAVGVAAIAAAPVVLALGARTADTIDHIADMANQANISAKSLSEYRTAAVDFVIPIERIAQSLSVLQTRMFDAARGQEKQMALFDAMGVSVTDADGQLRDVNDVFDEISTKIAGLSSATEQAAIANKVFGNEIGRVLLPLLKQGGAGLDAARRKAEDYSLVIQDDVLKTTEEYIQISKDFHNSFAGVAQTIGVEAIPTLTFWTVALSDSIAMYKKWLGIQSRTPEQQAEINRNLQRLTEELNAHQPEIERLTTLQTMWGRTTDENGKSIEKELELLERRQAQLRAQIAVEKDQDAATRAGTEGLLDRLKAAKEAAKEDTKGGSGSKKKPEDDGAAAEAGRVKELERGIKKLTSARVMDELAALDGAERIQAGLVHEIGRINDARDASLALARTAEERVRVNQEADAAIVASRARAEKQIEKIHKATESAENAASAARKTTAAKSAKYALQTTQQFASAAAAITAAMAERGKISAVKAAKVAKGFAIFQAALQIPLAISTTFAQAAGGPVAKGIQAAIAGVLATANLVAVVATPPPSFARGGIVPELPGQPYTRAPGDNQLVSANSGEMVLTKAQQTQLLAAANGRGGVGGKTHISLIMDQREIGRAMTRLGGRDRRFRKVMKAHPVGVSR